MLGNLYVAAKYWAWGYSDGMANAGASSSKRRKKYLIDGAVYWARPDEVPELLASALQAPAEAQKPLPQARSRPAKRAKEKVAITLAKPQPASVEARFTALLQQFTLAGNEELQAGLRLAMAILAERDDEEVVLLLM